jgi:hypothetical protein
MEIEKYNLEIIFTTPVLGTQPQKDVASEFIGNKFLDNGGKMESDELESLDSNLEKGTTAFYKLDGKPIFYDYQVKGFLKEAGRTFNGLDGVKSLRSKIDNMVFFKPRQILIQIPDGKEIEYLERPLRAETAQGPRVGLARSEMLPEGTKFECKIEVYRSQINYDILHDLLTYGANKGIGQWRNGGYGRFDFTLTK